MACSLNDGIISPLATAQRLELEQCFSVTSGIEICEALVDLLKDDSLGRS